MFRRLYDWVMRLARSRHAPASLAAISFAESSFFPIPPDVMLGPMVLARPGRAFVFAGICTAASVIGGVFGYAIGFFLEPLGYWLMETLGHPEAKAQFDAWFETYGLLAVVIAGFTPLPYKLVTIACGLAHFNFPVFVAASLATRGLRFFLVAGILKFLGPAMLQEFERRLNLYSILGLATLVGGFLVLKVFL